VQKLTVNTFILLLLAALQSNSASAQAAAKRNDTQGTPNEVSSEKPMPSNTQQSKSNGIYKVVAADGSVTYTDRPSVDAKPVAFDGKTQNVVTAAAPPPMPNPQVKAKQPNYTVSIQSPAPEATIRNNVGEITIQATQPSAPKAPIYRLVFNDAPYASNTSGVFRLSGIDRGAHTFKVELTNNTGKTLASSPLQTLYLHQASALINN
jgi:hypothetical protein